MSRNRSHRSPLIEALEARQLLAADPLNVIIGAGAAKSVQFTDATGTQAQIFISGAGTASLNFNGTGLSQSANKKGLVVNGSNISLDSVSMTGTNFQSVFHIVTTKKKALTVGTITTAGPINGLLAPTTTVTDITTGGALHVLQLGGAIGGTIAVGSGGAIGALAVQVGSVTDESLNSSIPITTFTASQWLNNAGNDRSITAPQIATLNVAHDFTADVTTGSVANVNVRGSISDSDFELTTPLTPLGKSLTTMRVGGAIAATTINAGGNIGSISAGRMSDSIVYAGLVADPSDTFPSVTTDFRNTASIFSVTLRKSASASFSNSVIAAYTINAANLGTVSQDNSGDAFGLAAHDVKSVTIQDLASGKTVHASNPPTTTAFDDDLTAKGVTPADFEVRIV